MKLTLGLSAALAGFTAAASQQSAPVYIFSGADADTTATTPSYPPSLARLVLLQRLASSGKGPSVADIPDNVDTEIAVSAMNSFGGQATSLCDQEQQASPSQLVIMLEGLTDDQISEMGGKFDSRPSFEISSPPSSSAHEQLVKNDLFNVGVTNDHKCSVKDVTNPFEKRCWSGKSTVAKYNVQKDSNVMSDLESQLSNLAALGSSGEMETMVMLLPSSGEGKKWSDKTQELRRRQSPSEQVISASDDTTEPEPSSSSMDQNTVFYASTRGVKACFESEDECITATGNCSGHGGCQDKYAKRDGESQNTCFACHCLSTVDDNGSLTHWAGLTCAKKDISTPFWLFAGFTLLMVGILALSIGMLFNVGEEKLPGVISAGVSRNK